MGGNGEPENHVNNRYQVVNGIDKGRGYQGYMAVDYFLEQSHFPQDAKDKIIDICKKENLIY